MSATLREAVRRVNTAPALVLGLWLVTTLVTIPLTLAVGHAISTQLESSLEADAAASGGNYDWLQEFMGQASGVAITVGPTVVGFAAVLDNLSDLLDNVSRPLVIVATTIGYLVLITFLAGGILDRLARNRGLSAQAFFASSGAFFFRFIRLGALAALCYGALFGTLHPWLFQNVFPRLTRDMTSERSAFFTRLGLYAVFTLLVGAINILFDYAKVRAVVEDRRSMFAALSSALAFVRRNAGVVVALYLLNFSVLIVVLALYAIVAPGLGAAGRSMWIGFAIGQVYVVGRLWVKLLFWSSEITLFQNRLAHAGWVRRPEPVWPDSPAVEAIVR